MNLARRTLLRVAADTDILMSNRNSVLGTRAFRRRLSYPVRRGAFYDSAERETALSKVGRLALAVSA